MYDVFDDQATSPRVTIVTDSMKNKYVSDVPVVGASTPSQAIHHRQVNNPSLYYEGFVAEKDLDLSSPLGPNLMYAHPRDLQLRKMEDAQREIHAQTVVGCQSTDQLFYKAPGLNNPYRRLSAPVQRFMSRRLFKKIMQEEQVAMPTNYRMRGAPKDTNVRQAAPMDLSNNYYQDRPTQDNNNTMSSNPVVIPEDVEVVPTSDMKFINDNYVTGSVMKTQCSECEHRFYADKGCRKLKPSTEIVFRVSPLVRDDEKDKLKREKTAVPLASNPIAEPLLYPVSTSDSEKLEVDKELRKISSSLTYSPSEDTSSEVSLHSSSQISSSSSDPSEEEVTQEQTPHIPLELTLNQNHKAYGISSATAFDGNPHIHNQFAKKLRENMREPLKTRMEARKVNGGSAIQENPKWDINDTKNSDLAARIYEKVALDFSSSDEEEKKEVNESDDEQREATKKSCSSYDSERIGMRKKIKSPAQKKNNIEDNTCDAFDVSTRQEDLDDNIIKNEARIQSSVTHGKTFETKNMLYEAWQQKVLDLRASYNEASNK